MLELLQKHGNEPVTADMTYSEGMALWKGMTGDDGIRFKQAKQMIYQFNLDPAEVLHSTYEFATSFITEAEADLATGAITIDPGTCMHAPLCWLDNQQHMPCSHLQRHAAACAMTQLRTAVCHALATAPRLTPCTLPFPPLNAVPAPAAAPATADGATANEQA